MPIMLYLFSVFIRRLFTCLLSNQNRSCNADHNTDFSVLWSVCLSHSCPVLKTFDRLRCYLADTLMVSKDTGCNFDGNP